MEGGWEKFIPKESDKEREQVISNYIIKRSEIPSFFSRENIEKINLFWVYKTLGLPFEGGWAEQPAYIIDIVTILESELGKRQKHNGR